MDVAVSKNHIAVRLTKERWFHITEGHPEMAGHFYDVLETVESPEIIYEGSLRERIAVKQLAKKKFIIVVYKEVNKKDGFVITAFFSRKTNYLSKRKIVWEKQK